MAQLDEKSTETVDMYHCKLRGNTRENLYLNAKMSDVNFVFYEKTERSNVTEKSEEDGSKSETKDEIPVDPRKIIEKVAAQKCVLASVCDAFFAMFYGPAKMEGDVEIVDVSPEAFKEFLQCFYLDHVRLTEENIADVMKLADKYGVTDCMDSCIIFLMDVMTPNDICWVYRLAIIYGLFDLQAFCEQRIALNAVQVFGSTDFLNCDRALLKEILSLKVMPCNETVILDSCLDWAKRACERDGLDGDNAENLRAQLGDCLALIRFGTISIEELCKRSACIGLFSSMNADSQTKRFWWDAENIWKCKRTATESSPYYMSHDSEVIYFTSNKTALLGGFYSADLSQRKGVAFNRVTTVTVKEIPGKSFNCKEGTILYQGILKFVHGVVPCVKLPIAILIDESNTYEIRFGTSGFDDLYSASMYSNKVDSGKGLSIEFVYDSGRGHLISSLDMNHL